MLRVTTLYASSAVATADYYTRYLTNAPGEVPGVWCGDQADKLGLAGDVATDALQALLEGRDLFEVCLGELRRLSRGETKDLDPVKDPVFAIGR